MERPLHFIEHIIEEDLAQGYQSDQLRFRFPPEPNGYLHIGHVKAICLNFNLGERYNAPVNLRFDDTNPAKEEQRFVDAIKENIQWLGYQWDSECYASDYFEELYQWAEKLIAEGKAYVDSQSSETMHTVSICIHGQERNFADRPSLRGETVLRFDLRVKGSSY